MINGQFLFVTWSGGGNTAPTYPLARCLAARGHKVTILGQAAQAEAARDLGARFMPLDIPDWTPGKSLEGNRRGLSRSSLVRLLGRQS
jgi:UDP:flavonoid glycosyltransferase YjiC (YdhE family)